MRVYETQIPLQQEGDLARLAGGAAIVGQRATEENMAALFNSEQGEGHWQGRALCAQTDSEAFFPEKGGSTKEAKRVCAACDVAAQCLQYALDNDERFGIWGGLSERERRKLKKGRVIQPSQHAASSV